MVQCQGYPKPVLAYANYSADRLLPASLAKKKVSSKMFKSPCLATWRTARLFRLGRHEDLGVMYDSVGEIYLFSIEIYRVSDMFVRSRFSSFMFHLVMFTCANRIKNFAGLSTLLSMRKRFRTGTPPPGKHAISSDPRQAMVVQNFSHQHHASHLLTCLPL